MNEGITGKRKREGMKSVRKGLGEERKIKEKRERKGNRGKKSREEKK